MLVGRSGWDGAMRIGVPPTFAASLTPMLARIVRIVRSVGPAIETMPRHDNSSPVDGIDRRRRIIGVSGVRRIDRRIRREDRNAKID